MSPVKGIPAAAHNRLVMVMAADPVLPLILEAVQVMAAKALVLMDVRVAAGRLMVR